MMTTNGARPDYGSKGTFKTNRYPGDCTDCGARVEAEAGIRFQAFGGGRWLVSHRQGQCPEPAPSSVQADPATQVQAAARTNRFAGKCQACAQWVEAEAGTIAKDGGKWVVSHTAGACPEPSTDDERKLSVPEVPEGHYATTSPRDDQDLDFWRVDHAKSGKTYVKRVIGGRPDTNVRFATMVAALDAILAEGIQACRERYADKLGACWRCNTHLTVGLSRLVKIGPECCKTEYGMTQKALAASRGFAAEVIEALAAAEAAAKAGDDDAELIEQAEAILAAAELAG